MPLFKCSICSCLENTALTPKSWGEPRDKMQCSECATGKWHGRFAKVPADDEYEPEEDGGHFLKLKKI